MLIAKFTELFHFNNGAHMLSGTSQYALRAVLYLAARSDETPIPTPDIASALDIPDNYLGKILYQLTRSSILVSCRGKRGGFKLARPANDMSLLEVIAPFDRFDERRICLLRRKECSDGNPCAAHARWKEVSEQVTAFFRETVVADLLSSDRKEGHLRRARLTAS
ncbi:MAG: Rrf2 family transcriptional regulator [Gemmatimonadales bacterium]|jgi:Rrf2 family iron-sulfur cluster assembly transcriptional regulator